MKKLLSTLALAASLGFSLLGANYVYADDVSPAATEASGVITKAADALAPTATTEAAPAATATAAPPVPNKGDTSWMIIATALVTLMTIPGLALFYGGLVRQKNMLSVLMQTFAIFSLMGVLWALYGYSVAFTGGNAFVGGLGKAFLVGITPDSIVATFSKGVVIPELIFVAFQLTFAAITPALIIGAFAERMKFSAVLLFMVIWFTFAYLPMAHMVWYWDGPDAITTAASYEAVKAAAGWLWAKGALDFAGGTVVHINAGGSWFSGLYYAG